MNGLYSVLTTSMAALPAAMARSTADVAQFLSGGIRSGVEAAHGTGQPTDLFGSGGIFSTAVNLLLFLIGAIAVIMIIVGGLRYILSGGNAASVTTAKNTILYAIVGIIVAILAYAVVNFVINSFIAGGTAGL